MDSVADYVSGALLAFGASGHTGTFPSWERAMRVQIYNLLSGVVIPILSIYLGFESYPWWTVLAIGAGGFLNYAMVNPEAVTGAFDERGLGYFGTALVFNSILPAILFAIGHGVSHLVYGA